jgi:hypothetical protein
MMSQNTLDQIKNIRGGLVERCNNYHGQFEAGIESHGPLNKHLLGCTEKLAIDSPRTLGE